MQGSPCNKCRQGVQAPGDSWCIGCSSLELAQTVLKVRWRHPGLRRICEETALSCARLCKAFQNLDRTLLAEEDKREEVLNTTAPKVKAEKPRSRSRALRSRSRSRRGRAASSAPARPAGGEELPTGDTDDSEYTWEDDDEADDKYHYRAPPVDPGKLPPPLPAGSPPRKGERTSRGEGRPGTRRRRPRGGTRHQRRYRDIKDPLRASHRKLGGEETELAKSFDEGLNRRR